MDSERQQQRFWARGHSMLFITLIVMFSSAGLAIYIAWRDFMTWKIENTSVLHMSAAFAVFALCAILAGPPASTIVQLPGAIFAALLLLLIGFALWALKLFGAGDAKLMAPVGLFVGWQHLTLYALCLIGFAVVAFALLKMPLPYNLGATVPGARLNEIRRTGKVPYGVVMVAALLVTGWVKYQPLVQAIWRTG